MSDGIDLVDSFERPSLIMTPMPMRDARQHYDIAGCESFCCATLEAEGLVFVQGKGGRCVMRQEEWTAYQQRCLEGAPMVSMLEATADEEDEVEVLTSREPSHFARSFREIEQCLLAYTRCISDDERDEIIRQIAAKIMPLKEAVLRAEEIWREENPDAETLRREDVEKLTHLNENEWLRGVVQRAGDYMTRPLGELSGDECAAVARELCEAAKFIRSGQKGGAA